MSLTVDLHVLCDCMCTCEFVYMRQPSCCYLLRGKKDDVVSLKLEARFLSPPIIGVRVFVNVCIGYVQCTVCK